MIVCLRQLNDTVRAKDFFPAHQRTRTSLAHTGKKQTHEIIEQGIWTSHWFFPGGKGIFEKIIDP